MQGGGKGNRPESNFFIICQEKEEKKTTGRWEKREAEKKKKKKEQRGKDSYNISPTPKKRYEKGEEKGPRGARGRKKGGA